MKKLILTALFSTVLMHSQAYAGDVQNGKSLYGSCMGCHGSNAEGVVGPQLSGQTADELTVKLNIYRDGGVRGSMSSMMQPMAKGLSDADIDDLTTYISSL